MEEDGEETPRTPFWIQSTTNVRRAELYRRRASSLFFNSGVLIILLLVFAVLSMVFIIPSLVSLTSQIFRPNLVKRSWDSINLVLVLVALAFGFLSRNINNDQKSGFDRSRSDLSTGALVASPSSSTPHQWYEFPDQPISGLRRHRSTSSYPDLRELSPPWNHRVEAPWRFSDDTHLNSHRVLNYDRYYFRREQDSDTKEVLVDTVVDLPKEDSYAPPPPQPPIPEEKSYSPSLQPQAPEDESYSRPSQPPAPEDESYSPPPQLPSPQSLPPQPPAPRPSATKKKPIRRYHNVAADEGETSSRSEVNEVLPETEPPVFQDNERRGEISRKRGKGERRRARSSEPRKIASPIDDPAPESPSPPRILPEFQDSERNTGGVERKRTGGNATKRFFTSFYQKKKKRQRQRSMDNLDTLFRHPQPPVKFQLPPPSPPPPPPPPPPPSSVLNNLFTSKKERRKKIASSTPPSPPPPPPPPRTAARAPKPTITRVSPFITEKPRVPVKMHFFNGIDDSSSGGESPMNRIPPPPPMPPFKMADWKFPVEGDYVRVQSTLSSGSVSPDGDDALSPSSAVPTPLFCPSPDVDTKADTFIARFRAGLKLEKINSFNKNQGLRMSNLGPGPGPSNY